MCVCVVLNLLFLNFNIKGNSDAKPAMLWFFELTMKKYEKCIWRKKAFLRTDSVRMLELLHVENRCECSC